MKRIYLSPPDIGSAERGALVRALDSSWVAPLGPEVDAFENELAAATGRSHSVALSSGTGALHLALLNAGAGPETKVIVQSLTFAATANAVMYTGAEPVFIDSEASSWNIDPDLLGSRLTTARASGENVAAVVAVDVYGQCCDYERIVDTCDRHDVTLIEDAAEAIGATYKGQPAGSFGEAAILSFNGNKIITTSGGGALVTDNADWASKTEFLATQARDKAPHYQHSELGFNYRLSNLLAAMGRAQLADLGRRVDRRRDHNRHYRAAFGAHPGIAFMPELPGGESSFWLTTLTVDPSEAGVDREAIRRALEAENIEARPVWKPMHLQPYYESAEMVDGDVSSRVFELGLCLPSGSNLSDDDRDRITGIVLDTLKA